MPPPSHAWHSRSHRGKTEAIYRETALSHQIPGGSKVVWRTMMGHGLIVLICNLVFALYIYVLSFYGITSRLMLMMMVVMMMMMMMAMVVMVVMMVVMVTTKPGPP